MASFSDNLKIVEKQTETLEKLDAKTIHDYFQREFKKYKHLWPVLQLLIQNKSGADLLSPSFTREIKANLMDVDFRRVNSFVEVLKKFQTKIQGTFHYPYKDRNKESLTITSLTTQKEQMEANQNQIKNQNQEEEFNQFVTTNYRRYAFNLQDGDPRQFREPGQDLLLIRKEFANLWDILENSQIQPLTTLIGLPGTGKSSLVWYWCLHYCTNNADHTLVWIQHQKDETVVVIISKMKLYFQTTNSPIDFVHFDANVVVFDGIRQTSHYNDARTDRLKNARKILVSSDHMDWEFTNEKTTPAKFDVHYSYNWTLDEYKTACRNAMFFAQVFPSLVIDGKIPLKEVDDDFTDQDLSTPTSTNQINTVFSKIVSLKDFETKYGKNMNLIDVNSLLASKHDFAGGSVRFMFEFSSDRVMNQIKSSIAELSNSISNVGVRNTLQARFHSVERLGQGRDKDSLEIVSKFVARSIAASSDETVMFQLLSCIASSSDYKPMTCILYEMMFLNCILNPPGNAHFSLNGYHYPWKGVQGDDSEQNIFLPLDKNSVPRILFVGLDQIKSTFANVKSAAWFVPTAWNQGGYDCVLITNPEKGKKGLIRMIQITIAHSYFLKLRYFKDLIEALELKKEDYDFSISAIVPQEEVGKFKFKNPEGSKFISKMFPNWKSRTFVYGWNTVDTCLKKFN